MLIKCPECDLQVSDKAISCPHCGYPMKEDAKPRKSRSKNNKRMRLPNGFGQISEIKDRNLRNPFRAMITVGKKPNGRPICRLLKPNAYFATYNEAYAALMEYNKNPYDFDKEMTVKELYEKWSREHYENLAESSIRVMESAWGYCSAIYDMPVQKVRTRHIKGCMNDSSIIVRGEERSATPAIKERIKMLLNMMFDYALEYELVDKNYARTFSLSKGVRNDLKESRTEHIAYTDDELELLWNNLNSNDFIDIVLIQCYSGWRPQELLSLKIEDIDINNGIFIGGMKTKTGKNRPVPIHSKIKDLVEKRYNYAKSNNSQYLFYYEKKKTKLSYHVFLYQLDRIKKQLALDERHKPHDGRVTFVTNAKKYNVDEYAIKYIVGHTIQDLTEQVYTKRNVDWLKEEIEKIK